MALRIGEDAPHFTAEGSDGRTWTAEGLRGRPYILTFYPQDETAGCVAQVCALRDVWEDLRDAGVLVFGVSRDSIASHQAFAANRKLPYTLLSDPSGAMHKAYDIGRWFGVTRRMSYLIDAQGRISEAYSNNLRPAAHAGKMVDAVGALVK